MDYLASVVQAIPREDDTVYSYFNDVSVRRADIKLIIAKGGIFTSLADDRFFRERLTVMNGCGGLGCNRNMRCDAVHRPRPLHHARQFSCCCRSASDHVGFAHPSLF